jgi:actin-related protein
MDEFGSDLNSFINLGEKGSDTIVFQLGSHSMKFGLASQLTPFVIPMTIAYLKNKSENDMEIDGEENENDYTDFNYVETESFNSGINALEQDTLKKMAKLEQKLKIKTKSNLPKTYTNIKVIYLL